MDESMGDDSSTATLPLDHSTEDAYPAIIAASTFTPNEVLEKATLLPSTTPSLSTPAPKPVKVSLKQYQSMQKRSLPGGDD
jgi:hypothetical protein